MKLTIATLVTSLAVMSMPAHAISLSKLVEQFEAGTNNVSLNDVTTKAQKKGFNKAKKKAINAVNSAGTTAQLQYIDGEFVFSFISVDAAPASPTQGTIEGTVEDFLADGGLEDFGTGDKIIIDGNIHVVDSNAGTLTKLSAESYSNYDRITVDTSSLTLAGVGQNGDNAFYTAP